MTDDGPTRRQQQQNYDNLPPKVVTANQLAAYNVAYWRLEKGMTQEELGELLAVFTGKPWSKATVSAAERSWDGKRIRQFDADELFALSEALEVPLAGLFVPPTDDGVDYRYGVVTGPQHGGENAWPIREFLNFLISEVDSRDGGNIGEFRDRLEGAIDFHYGNTEGRMPLRTGNYDEKTQLRLRVVTLQAQREALRTIMGEIERETNLLHKRLETTPGGVLEENSEPTEYEDLQSRIEHAFDSREDFVVLHHLTYLGHAVPSDCDRLRARALLDVLRSHLMQDSSMLRPIEVEIGQMLAEAVAKASDYRTPWYRLSSFCREMSKGIEQEFAVRMADRINAGEVPAAVAEDVGLEWYSLRQILLLKKVKVTDAAVWPPNPWEEESSQAVSETAHESLTSNDAAVGHTMDTPSEGSDPQ